MCARPQRVSADVGKRDAILEKLAAFILAEGLEAATVRAMAKAAGQSDRMLLYYFADKDEIIAEAVTLLAGQLTAILAANSVPQKLRKDPLHAHLDGVVLSDEVWPYLRLWLDLAARAAREDADLSAVAQGLGQGFHQWIESQLATTDPDLRRKEATHIMIGLEGIVVLRAVGMQDLVRELL